jgi:NhaA family Na+:H+ antiporter
MAAEKPKSVARPPLAKRILSPFAEFDKLETSGSIVLLTCAALAVALANTGAAGSFLGFWNRVVPAGNLELTLKDWINDGLMALFFFVVGLEIKRELIIGELSSWRRAMLPILSAAGGMIVPAGIYLAFNPTGPSQTGWGVPMATDIAFSLGVMALLGSRAPVGLKVFLTALAIADDLGAVFVIALFYSPGIQWSYLAGAAAILGLVYAVSRRAWDSPWLFVLAAAPLWFLTHASGIHATLAGVGLALCVPARRKTQDAPVRVLELSLLEGILHRLHPWVTYLVVPAFALANAGVALSGTAVGGEVAWGIAAGLFLGKPVGIVGAAALGIGLKLASLPRRVTMLQIVGAGALAGIGFTMSLFIAELAFGAGPMLDSAKIAIYAASTASALAGYLVLRFACPAGEATSTPAEGEVAIGPSDPP